MQHANWPMSMDSYTVVEAVSSPQHDDICSIMRICGLAHVSVDLCSTIRYDHRVSILSMSVWQYGCGSMAVCNIMTFL